MGDHVDRRDQFARALWAHADSLRQHEHERRARSSCVTALVRIALNEAPITSAAQGRRVKSVGDRLEPVLAAAVASRSRTTTEAGKYAAAAAALLVALSDLEASVRPAPLRDLLDAASALLEGGRAFLEPRDLAACGAWAQMTPLVGALAYVKKRSRVDLEGGAAYELTDAGRAAAAAARARAGTGADATVPARAWAPVPPSPADAILVVDCREGGGERGFLPTIARFLEDEGVAYETRRVPTGFGDYVLCRRSADLASGGGLAATVAPVLVERKAAVDVADSLRDGRWASQHAAMVATARAVWGPRRVSVRVVYVVEGDPSEHVHRACGCGCLGVGRCGNPTARAVEEAIAARAADGVEIARTADVRGTARYLASEYARYVAGPDKGDFNPSV